MEVQGFYGCMKPPLREPHNRMKDVNVNKQVLASAIIAAVAGYLAVWLPWKLAGSHNNMVDGMELISLLYLMLVGFGCALAVPHRFWIAGLASMSLFPVMAIVGAVLDPTTHNLLGIELIMYVFLTIPVLLGGAIGKLIRVLLARRRK
jgi:uncharacterized membrane protein